VSSGSERLYSECIVFLAATMLRPESVLRLHDIARVKRIIQSIKIFLLRKYRQHRMRPILRSLIIIFCAVYGGLLSVPANAADSCDTEFLTLYSATARDLVLIPFGPTVGDSPAAKKERRRQKSIRKQLSVFVWQAYWDNANGMHTQSLETLADFRQWLELMELWGMYNPAATGQPDFMALADSVEMCVAANAFAQSACRSNSPLRVCVSDANQLEFFWDKLPSANFYRFYVDTGDAPPEQFGGDIAAIAPTDDEHVIHTLVYPIAVHTFDWTNALFYFESCSYDTDPPDDSAVTCVVQGYQTVSGMDRFAVRSLQSPIGEGTGFAISSAISKDGLFLAVGANQNSIFYCPAGYEVDVLDVVDGEDVLVDTADEFCELRNIANPDYDPLITDEDDPAYAEYLEVGFALGEIIPSAGAVFLYERTDTNEPFSFFPTTTLLSPNRDANDNFGFSVAVSQLDDGTRLVAIAAPAEDSDGSAEDSNDAVEAGAVYIFSGEPVVEVEPDTGDPVTTYNWFARQPGSSPGPLFGPVYLKASNAGAGDLFGYDLDFSEGGIFLAVAAPGESSSNDNPLDNSAKCAGAVYVFENGAGSWSETEYLKASTPSTRDVFGQSVSLDADGSTLAVGASQLPNLTFLGQCYDNPPSSAEEYSTFIEGQAKISEPGEAYVFERTGSAWAVANSMPLVAPGRSNGDSFGNSVSLSGDGDVVAVGAPFEDNEPYGFDDKVPTGAAYVFSKNAASWPLSLNLKAPDTQSLIQLFGATVKLNNDGSLLGIGATGKCTFNLGLGGNADFIDCGGFGATGAAYLYKNNQQLVFINPPVALPSGARFGSGIDFAEDGASLVINARRAGMVFIY
jgi:hypothetical protein